MDYKQTLDYLFSQLPMFHRIGAAAYKANLDNTLALSEYLGYPEKKFPSIHVAGTNGKGSVSHLLASILQESGYKTALCTSPHLKDFRERIKINGEMVPEEFVTDFIGEHKAFFEQLKPSFFEMTIALSFQYIANSKVDIAVIETGLGGRLDSTNIVRPEVSIITNIGLDHTNLLGDTIEKIAFEKAGIIKQGVPVIIGLSLEATKVVFEQKAASLNSSISYADQVLSARNTVFDFGSGSYKTDVYLGEELFFKELYSPLGGFYQPENLQTVICACLELQKLGWKITKESIRKGIENVIVNTGLQGRWQVLQKHPRVICDTGHNVDGIRFVVKQLGQVPYKKLHFVLGMMNDKDISGVLAMLPKDAIYYFCKADVPRGMDATMLKEKAGGYDLKGETFESVAQAYQEAKKHASDEDLVFVGGSTFVVAEVV